ncbi:MAG: hypothetical protein DRI90_06035 [Deltaproteobacteria bacterium]|nr:MAG: hypothetical protein DRI90_06035 [Deltaproteobacteria bacterium]
MRAIRCSIGAIMTGLGAMVRSWAGRSVMPFCLGVASITGVNVMLPMGNHPRHGKGMDADPGAAPG